MSILPTATDYTALDFDAMRDRIFSLVRSVFPNWTDDAAANFGNLLIESHAFVLDVLAYYQNRQSRESRWSTVELRKNMLALAKLINYTPSPATAASCDVTLTITNADQLSGTVSVPGGNPVIVKTTEVTDPVQGELDGTVSFNLSLGETSKSYTWRHRLTRDEYIVASTNRADQEIMLPFGSFLWDTETVWTVSDGTFSRVDNFLSSGPNDLHYRLEIDHNDKARIRFGDGQTGKIPSGDIHATYKTGGGAVGEVEAGALTRVATTLTDSEGNTAYLTATNASGATGGGAAETVEAARVNGPASLRVLTRAVAREDYEIVAKLVPGVGRALHLTSNEDSTVDENRGKLYIVPTGGGDASSGLVNDTYGAFGLEGQASTLPDGDTYKPHTTFQLQVLSAAYLSIDVQASIWMRTGYNATTVKAAIEAALEDWFSPMNADGSENENVDFGYNYKDVDDNPAGEVAWSDIFNVIRDVAGVRKVDQGMKLNGAVDDVTLSNWVFPSLGTVTLYDGDTGNQI